MSPVPVIGPMRAVVEELETKIRDWELTLKRPLLRDSVPSMFSALFITAPELLFKVRLKKVVVEEPPMLCEVVPFKRTVPARALKLPLLIKFPFKASEKFDALTSTVELLLTEKFPLAVMDEEKVFVPVPLNNNVLNVSPPDLEMDCAEEPLNKTVPVPETKEPELLQLPATAIGKLLLCNVPLRMLMLFAIVNELVSSLTVTLPLLITILGMANVEFILMVWFAGEVELPNCMVPPVTEPAVEPVFK